MSARAPVAAGPASPAVARRTGGRFAGLRRPAARAEEALPERVTLTQRRIYILPTRQGVMFAATLVLMLVGSINYNLGLGYLLTFLLVGLLIVGLLHTWRNLAGLEVRAGRQEPVFAGEPVRFRLLLSNAAGITRFAIGTRCGTGPYHHADVPPRGEAEIVAEGEAARRGRVSPGRILLVTTYPLGLYRAWSYVRIAVSVIAYPRPEPGAGSLPPPEAATGEGPSARRGEDDFAGLRSYQRGDSPKRIAWKAMARREVLVTKEFSGGTGLDELWLDWAACPADFGTEARLSRLAAWVLAADAASLRYGLRLPGREIAPGTGRAHRDACLEALALHP